MRLAAFITDVRKVIKNIVCLSRKHIYIVCIINFTTCFRQNDLSNFLTN